MAGREVRENRRSGGLGKEGDQRGAGGRGKERKRRREKKEEEKEKRINGRMI